MRRRLTRRIDQVYSRLATFTALPGTSEASGLEWLLDNHYVVRGALNQVGQDLPVGHHGRLPAVRDENGKPIPRLARITRLLLEATGAPLDLERMRVAVLRLEADLPLSLSELWALPVFLRAELLRRLAEAAIAMLARSNREVDGDAVHADQAPGTVISSCILGLRLLASYRWLDFVERTSLVDEVLRGDPAGAYARMDPESRDRYRKAVEELADHSTRDEPDVARAAISMAAAQPAEAALHLRHAGYYLVDDGRDALELAIGARPAASERFARFARQHAIGFYLSLILVPAAALVLLGSAVLRLQGLGAVWVCLFVLVATIPAISMSTAGGNWLVTALAPPRTPLRLDFEKAIPPDWPTVVVMPAMLIGEDEIHTLVRNLELNYLGNADPTLRFALLTDWADASSEREPGEEELLALAVAAVDELNDRYGSESLRPFALFHRRRLWNEAEGRWMGWERKRGKLAEFNRLLLGEPDTSFELCHPDPAQFLGTRIVVTLDADTRMPAGVAANLAAVLAHPLNTPEVDARTGRLVRGYTVVQPRVETDPASVEESLFARIFAGDPALDLYVHAVSDVYQDLFGAGIYAGKGAYDVAAFHASVDGGIPGNTVLSHDLLEGAHGRVAYASDIMLLEDFPANLTVMLRRTHRWVRGDWQLLPWILGARSLGGHRLARLAAIDRWKLLDNLRRSLQPVSLVALLLLAWLVAAEPMLWTLVIIVLPGAPAAAQLISTSRTSAWRWGTWALVLGAVVERVAAEVLQWLANLAFLPFEAWVSLDAITRALYRQHVRRGLLEWEPAAATAARLRGSVTAARNFAQMWPCWATGLAALSVVATLRPEAMVAAAPIMGLWCLAPWLATVLGRRIPNRDATPLAPRDAEEVRVLARRTWRFFEQFVGPDSHWLPPDNVQVAPGYRVAHRTSPTNIGLTLLATLSAYDFGYLTLNELLTRLEGTLHTMRGLSSYRGHLYNWYETRNLQPLEPRYVSTVDSGNLVAALVTVRQALLSADRSSAAAERLQSGLADTLMLLERLIDRLAKGLDDNQPAEFARRLGRVRHELVTGSAEPSTMVRAIVDFVTGELQPGLLRMIERGASASHLEELEELSGWMRCLLIQAASVRREPDEPQDFDGRIARICTDIDEIVAGTDFRFLFDDRRKLFHIGYNASAGEVDSSYYDLLASEARIASFVAIAKGDVPAVHWMHLGRPLRRVRGHRTLLSWSATAFEYLMPRLLMKTPRSGLLFHSCLVAVAEQQRAASRLNIPWGMSESGYYQMDIQGEYQYRAFGLSRLALRREQSDRVVITPYASVLALPFDADAVVANLRDLALFGLEGTYGMAEAADFGHPAGDFSRRPRIVHSFMAHHQGMIMTALGNAVHRDLMVWRFHADCRIASAEHLLYERLPRRPQAEPLRPPFERRPRRIEAAVGAKEWQVDPARPALNVLSNGHLRTLITSQGGGATYWNDLMLNRWRPEADGEYGGAAIFLRDLDSGELWSLGWDELGGDVLQVEFAAHQSEFLLRRNDLMARQTVAVAAHGDLELRRLILGNDLDRPRRLQVGFQVEPVMAPEAEDRRHPAFNKLFIECEGPVGAADMLFRRRPRAAEEPALFVGYSVAADEQARSTLRCDSDRMQYTGRRGDPRRPAAFKADRRESPDGPVSLDPVAALELEVLIPPLASVQCAFLTAVGCDRHRVLDLLDSSRSLERVAWIISRARPMAEQEITLLGLRAGEIELAMGLAGHLMWPPRRPQRTAALESCRKAQQSLWSRGLSGDYPVAALRLRGPEDLDAAELLLRIHALLRRRGFEFDLMFLDEASAGYSQPTRDRLAGLIDKSRELPAHHQHRGLAVIVQGRDLSPLERNNLLAAASLYLDPEELAPQEMLGRSAAPRVLPEFVPVPSGALESIQIDPVSRGRALQFDNGYGGFACDGREYQIHLESGTTPPSPWVNVMANPDFGAIVSDGGLGFTWAGNSSEYRLTPWYNDPVTDRTGEACFLRDEETAAVWSPTPLPLPAPSAYRISHGAGYTRFEHNSHGLEQVLTVFVDPSRPLKYVRVALRNRWPRMRRLTATLALDWVLGNDRQQTSRWLVTGHGAQGRVLTVRNAFDRNHSDVTAFLTATLPPHGTTGDRGNFLGRARHVRQVPAALRCSWPSSAGPESADPGAAYQAHLVLEQGQTAQVTFVIGCEATRERALAMASEHLDEATIDERWRALEAQWDHLLGSVQIETPDAAWNLLGNRWLLYQGISCRLWGRSGFYQPGGAYGFRDQLQDVLAMLHVTPAFAREQLLRAASVQFQEGDVLHWWHTSPLRGVRSRCSDDLLWLPFATAAYVLATGDAAVLDEQVAFLQGEPLAPWQLEQFAEFTAGGYTETLYEHCCRAIEARLTTGRHGLPPIGTGDWNDGFNRVGLHGQGESVWMAWFMIRVCRDFAPLSADRGELGRRDRYLEFADRLAEAANGQAWDGEWFLRGYYDDGAGLGGHADDVCQIDLNAQTWAVLADAAPRERQVDAMKAAANRLADRDARVLRLLTPPFDHGERDPGYIRGYPPGIRENGSQYNHAAAWAVWAAVDLGWHAQAAEWFDWIHPVKRAATTQGAERYALEPYVVAGDICSSDALAGRGGWSWYTGSASWLYRVLVERLLGLQRRGAQLRIRPCVPDHWHGYGARLRYGASRYVVKVESPFRLAGEAAVIEVDGQEQVGEWITLVDDGKPHEIVVRPAAGR